MRLEILTKVVLKEDIPEYDLKKGDIGTIVEYYPRPKGEEDAYSLEGFDTVDNNTVEVRASQIEPLEV